MPETTCIFYDHLLLSFCMLLILLDPNVPLLTYYARISNSVSFRLKEPNLR